MLILMPILMAYSLVSDYLHEIIGMIIFILFLVHHLLNRKWFLSLKTSKHNSLTAFRAFINIGLMILMLAQPLSGIFMSKYLYSFPSVINLTTLRKIHLSLAYWLFVLISVHSGTHLHLSQKQSKQKKEYFCLIILTVVVSLHGVYAFYKRSFLQYMFLRNIFVFYDFSEPLFYFFFDYLAIMILFMIIGNVIINYLTALKKTLNNSEMF